MTAKSVKQSLGFSSNEDTVLVLFSMTYTWLATIKMVHTDLVYPKII